MVNGKPATNDPPGTQDPEDPGEPDNSEAADPGSDEDGGSEGDPSGPGSGCFVSGTRILGATCPLAIDTVRPGAEIWAYDTAKWRPALRRILRVFEHRSEEILTLDFGHDIVSCTALHRFYTGIWTAAARLTPGQRVLSRDGGWRTLQRITRATHPQAVFNLLVEGLHNYFVGPTALLVHNEKDSRLPDDDPGWPDDVD